MITSAVVDSFMSVNMDTVDKSKLVDIRTLEFDTALSKEKRTAYILEKLENPMCFRCGEVGVSLEFNDNAPSTQEVFTNFMIRKKSGL
jgi:hypothetical protein